MSAAVHVFGSPDKDALTDEERLCTDGRPDELVTYHVEARTLGLGWYCVACGYVSYQLRMGE